jgi:hypothetical protein
MPARDRPHRVSHGEDREAEGQRDAGEADAEPGEAGGKDRAAATTEHKPEGAEFLG